MAIEYEANRQVDLIEDGGSVDQETRLFDTKKNQTRSMRSKEDAHDYRYLPDPDLLPIHTADLVVGAKFDLPELPHEKVGRFEKDYGITHYDASVLAADVELANYYEQAARGASSAKKVANWVINNLLGVLNDQDIGISECLLTPDNLRGLVDLIEEGQITNSQAKEVFTALFESPDKTPAAIAREKGFEPADSGEIDAFIDQAIADNPGPAGEVSEGNDKAINFLTGQVMKLSRGKANPKQVSEGIIARLRG